MVNPLLQDDLGTEGVVVLDGDADCKRVRMGTRAQTSKKKQMEFEDSSNQEAAFQRGQVTINANTKETHVTCAMIHTSQSRAVIFLCDQ